MIKLERQVQNLMKKLLEFEQGHELENKSSWVSVEKVILEKLVQLDQRMHSIEEKFTRVEVKQLELAKPQKVNNTFLKEVIAHIENIFKSTK